MARRPKFGDEQLYVIATYLSRPAAKAEIHAELPAEHRKAFEAEYAAVTNGYPLPTNIGRQPYYVWPKGTNKQGRELRVYFARVAPEPPSIRDIYTDYGKWYARNSLYRINHSNLVMQLFECGFLLGLNTGNGARIDTFMQQRFPVKP